MATPENEVTRWAATAETAARAALAKLPQGHDLFWAALIETLGPCVRAARALPGKERVSDSVSWTLAGALHGYAEAVAVRALNGDADPEPLVDGLIALALTISRLDERDVLISAGRVYEAVLDRKLDGDALIARAQRLCAGAAEGFLGRFGRRPAAMRGAAIGGDMIVGPPGGRRFVPASLFSERQRRPE